jgi:16S rRNA processing protein RimM
MLHSGAVSAASGLEPAELPIDAIEVARVLGAWGIKGGLKVKPFAADPQALFSTKRWYLLPSELPRPVVAPGGKRSLAAPAFPALLRVAQAREQGEVVVATVDGLDDRDLAEALKGARVFVSRQSFPTPDEGEFYWVDLIGLAVVNRAGLGLGEVVGLIETGPHCVLRVQVPQVDGHGEPGSECLIPFVAAYVDAVDLKGRRISVDWEADY